MVPAEFVAQDHAYRMLKLRLQHDLGSFSGSINIVQLADEIGLSRTPVREAVFRLVGEGVMEPAEHGGYRLYRPTARQLRDLYLWGQHLLPAMMQSVPSETLFQNISVSADIALPPGIAIPVLFQAIADATRNGEFSRQLRNMNERLLTARQAEPGLIDDIAEESVLLLQAKRQRDIGSLQDRVVDYHRRRSAQADAIAAAILRA